MERTRKAWRRAAVWAAAAVVGGGFGGCSSEPTPGLAAHGELKADDFKGTADPAAPALKPVRAPVAHATAAEAGGGVEDVRVLTGNPMPKMSENARPAREPIAVDSLVGQVNGRPIFASKFLAPLDGQLRAMVTQARDDREWTRAAAKLIHDRLYGEVRDELFLAEARASLPPEARQGLFQFLERLRENLSSMYYGNEEVATEKLRESEGVSLEEKAKSELDQQLIRLLVSKYVKPKVNVSWRDVTREYERAYKDFHPIPKAVMRMVQVETKNADGVAAVTAELAAGKPFEEVASGKHNLFVHKQGGVYETTYEGEYAQAKLFAIAELNDAAQRLTEGSTVGPVEWKDAKRTVWLHLDRIEQPRVIPLEEAQLKIYFALADARFNEETGKFFKRILERGSFDDIQLMTERLLTIASERYLIIERAQQGRKP